MANSIAISSVLRSPLKSGHARRVDKRQIFGLLAVGLCLSVTCASLAQKKTVGPADFTSLRTVQGVQVSPDGKFVAYTVETPVGPGQHRSAHIWIASTDRPGSGRPYVYSSTAELAPQWSPDSKHLAFLSDQPNPLADSETAPFRFSLAPGTARADIPKKLDRSSAEAAARGMQLWWISMDGGVAEPLTAIAGGVRSFKWSHSGDAIAFIRTDADTPEEAARKAARNDEVVMQQNLHFDRLWILNVAQRQARLITTTDLNIDAVNWSPDDRSFIARVSPSNTFNDYWYFSHIVNIDAATGKIGATLVDHSGWDEPSFSRDGQYLAFSRYTPANITFTHIIRRLSDGSDNVLEDKLPGTVMDVQWLGSGSGLLVSNIVNAHTETFTVDASNAAIASLPNITVGARRFHASADGKTIALLGETPQRPFDVYVWREGHLQPITDLNPQVADWSLGTQREISWQNPDDHLKIYGILYLPPGYQPGVRYKTIVHAHGGPSEVWTMGFNGNWYDNGAILAAHGYVVLQPNPRGSVGQGLAFTNKGYQDWGGADFADVMAGVDSLVTQGIADPDRLAIGGWSYGGFMAAWAVTHTDRFKVAMVGAGVTDLFSIATTTQNSPGYLNRDLGEFPSNTTLYDRVSAVRYLEQCHTPVLVLHGEADTRVPVTQGEEFYNGLRFRNKPAMMVEYPREDHIFVERAHQVDSLNRILDWYDSHLGK